MLLDQQPLPSNFFRLLKGLLKHWLCHLEHFLADPDTFFTSSYCSAAARRSSSKTWGASSRIGRVMREHDLKSGEIGVLVHDDFQGKGLGYKLVETPIGIAKEKSIEELRGFALTENTRLLRMVREFDFTRQYLPGGTTEIRLKLE